MAEALIAHYRISSKIGEGGMGAVYRATDTKLNREVAIKVLPDAFARDPERLARFTREAQVLASLNHPHIAAIYGVEDRALVLELVEGKAPAGPMSEEEVLPLAQQLIDALEYAHEHGVVHRDLKPANMRVTGDGTLKLLDFGLAKAVETTQTKPAPASGDSPTLTIAASLPGVILGTAAYMSPEQARGGKVDHRTDIWAFGVVLYELITGKPAFAGETVSDTLAAVLKSDPDYTLLPPRIRPLVEHCLARDLKQRLGWIGDARLLLASQARTGEQNSPDGGTAPSRLPATVWVGAVAALAAALGFGAARWLPWQARPAGLPAAKIVRVTTDGASLAASVTADGKLVAYGARRAGRRSLDLWVQQTAGGAAIRLTDDVMFSIFPRPRFSADGTKVYYRTGREPAGIYEVPVFGGEPHLVIAGQDLVSFRPSPDGKWLAYIAGRKLWLKPAEGGEPKVLAEGVAGPGVGYSVEGLLWSPDSTRIMTLRLSRGGSGEPPQWFLVSLEGTESKLPSPRSLLAVLDSRGFRDLNLIEIVAWLPGDDLVFAARYGDATNLWRLPLANLDREPEAVTLGPWSNKWADIRGNHLVFTNFRSTNQVWRLPADLDSGKVTGEPERVTEDLVESQFPDVRADGGAMAYISVKMGGQGVFLFDFLTGKERRLYLSATNAAYATFSPDGSQVAFGVSSPDFQSMVVPAAGGEPKPIGKAGGRIRGWSRDGRCLLVWRANRNSPPSIGVLELETQKAVETMRAEGGLGSPRFSPDNRWVAFQVNARQRGQVRIAPFRGSTPVAESEWIAVGTGVLPFWSPDGRNLYFLRYSGESGDASLVMRQPIDSATGKPAGNPTEFYRFDPGLNDDLLNSISVTRKHVYVVQRTGPAEIWMMDLR